VIVRRRDKGLVVLAPFVVTAVACLFVAGCRDEPGDYYNHGCAYHADGQYGRAISEFTKVIEIQPEFVEVYLNRGRAYDAIGEYERAVSDYAAAVQMKPRFAAPYNSLAWLFATSPDESYRDGRKAIVNATRACELSKWADAGYLDTLAAAYAEAGQFEQAVKWQTRATGMLATGDDKFAMESRLEAYKAAKPYRREAVFQAAGHRQSQSDQSITRAGGQIRPSSETSAAALIPSRGILEIDSRVG
jgi:tetratricopeptide (TPR) repeat protein